MDKSEKVLTIEEVQKMWDNMTTIYPTFDSSPQGFYFSIVNILQIPKAKNILEVGCGRCLLVPYTLELKNSNATYWATDLSPKMIDQAKQKLQSYLDKFDSKLTFQEWCKKIKLQLRIANGQEKIAPEIKFDRIICNMVLMLTENPQKMLSNLYEQAEQGCLLGISVWGNKELNFIQEQMQRVVDELKVQTPKMRSNFHLYNKVSDLGQKTGWKTVAKWEQVNVFPYLYAENLDSYAKGMTIKMTYLTEQQRKWVYEQYMRRQRERLDNNKQALTFPAQIIILKK